MMVIKLEKKGKLVKSWSFDKVDSVTEQSVIEALDDVYTTINRFRKERGTAEVEV